MDAADEARSCWQISSLLSLYYQALDRGDLETLASEVIASDAVWEVVQIASVGRIEDKVKGRDAIIAWFEQMLSGSEAPGEGTLRHFVNTHVIRIDPDGHAAHSTSYLQGVDTVTMLTRVSGFVEAAYVRGEEGWRIGSYKVEERLSDADMQHYESTVEKS